MPLFILLAAASAAPPQPPQYIFINKAPGIEWNQAEPETFTCAGFDAIVDTIDAPHNPALRIGVSFNFSFFRTDPAPMQASLRRFLALSEETGVPVVVGFDGQNWWGARPDLWNWWNPERPGYDPANVHNVEWHGWGPEHALRIAWRNWGSQIRVLPPPNLMSPAVLGAHRDALDTVLPIVRGWYEALSQDKKYLLGAVKLGHEASIGVNAYYYPNGNALHEQYPNDPSHDPTYGRDPGKGWHGGLVPIGYAAVKTAGLKDRGNLTRIDIAEVTHRYLESLARKAHEHGLPRHRVYTHQGGTYEPWEKSLPFWPAINDYAMPGWSFYGVDPEEAGPLGETLDTRQPGAWAAVEWWWGAPGPSTWRDHFERTLRYKNCRFVTVYNWNCGFTFNEEPGGLEAVRRLVQDWNGNTRGGVPQKP